MRKKREKKEKRAAFAYSLWNFRVYFIFCELSQRNGPRVCPLWGQDRSGQIICPVEMTGVLLALGFMCLEILYLNGVAPRITYLATWHKHVLEEKAQMSLLFLPLVCLGVPLLLLKN